MSSESLSESEKIQISSELCRRSYYEFFLEFWETIEAVELVPNWHIEYICNQLQEIYELWEKGESQPDVIINIPPGSSKSTMVTQLYPAWLWVKNPSIRIISSSYAADLSISHAVKTRDCLKSDKFQAYFPGLIEFKQDADGKTNYKNTAKGERFVTSTGGRVTGMHGDFIINDDPINPEETNSEKARETAVRFSGRTLSTRKTNKKRTVTILIMQRLHELDPTGDWVKKKSALRHICLPGEATKDVKPPELVDRYVDGLLDVNRLDKQALSKLKEDLGSYGYAGQILQTPSPEEGGILKSTWFKKISYAEFISRISGRTINNDIFVDGAYTEKTTNDPSAVMATVYADNYLYILDSTTVYKELPALTRFTESCRSQFDIQKKNIAVRVEPKASGKSLVQTLKTQGVNAIETPAPTDDKVARAMNCTPFIEAGRCWIVEGNWNDAFLNECKNFPNGAHDDQVDNLTNAISHYNKKKPQLFAG